MQASEIRRKFVDFFNKNDHHKIASSSLIPHNDDTLLFANAGMNQFKTIFTGQERPEHKRAITIQKCVRAGGKHNDLDNVGFTARHHTFFEMLGNFSFGDYFKKEAIEMAWSFLTKELKIPAQKLYVTVHHSDQEALEIWRDDIGIESSRIFKKGDKDNFWEMGEFGPCGPCSEIFYDHGESYATPNFVPKADQDILDDELRYVEIWNLVFMQYEKTPEGQKSLPHPCIDTGAGLERLCALMQGKYWNYDTDLFEPIIKKIEALTGKSYQNKTYQSSIRVVSDHIRSATMLITDGVIPASEGRGYVLRRIIRRAIRHLRELEAPAQSLYQLIDPVFDKLADEYPQNDSNRESAVNFLKAEEKKFLETLDNGIKFLNDEIKKQKSKTLSGQSAFKLYDTFGFPLDLTETILKERNLQLDKEGFELAMEKQKETSKKSWKGGQIQDDTPYYNIVEKFGETVFLGYDLNTSQSKLLKIMDLPDQKIGLVFDSTPFYAEGGGQVGDSGEVQLEQSHSVFIEDTIKPVEGLHLHICHAKDKALLTEGKSYLIAINTERRAKVAAHHSATHLLQAALIAVLGGHVKQAGSHVDDKRLRFDFTHMQAVTKNELLKVEELVNQQIRRGLEVNFNYMDIDSAIKNGAIAMFGEKYSEQVRVLAMGDFSMELCGGTHVSNTSNIQAFKIVSESSLASGVRRIEAIAHENVYQYLNERSLILEKIEASFNTKSHELIGKIEQTFDEIKKLQKEKKSLTQKIQSTQANEMFNSPEMIEGIPCILTFAPDNSSLRELSDTFKSKHDKGLLFLAAKNNDKTAILVRANNIPNFDSSSTLKQICSQFNGKGGGRKDMAQGSISLTSNKNEILNYVKDIITEQIRSK